MEVFWILWPVISILLTWIVVSSLVSLISGWLLVKLGEDPAEVKRMKRERNVNAIKNWWR